MSTDKTTMTSSGVAVLRDPIRNRGTAFIHAQVKRPLIFPLSNPTKKIEAHPADLVRGSEGRALIGTGTPWEPVAYHGVHYKIGQANNALVYPVRGLGTVVARAEHVTPGMIRAAAEAVAGLVNTTTPGASAIARSGQLARHLGHRRGRGCAASGRGGCGPGYPRSRRASRAGRDVAAHLPRDGGVMTPAGDTTVPIGTGVTGTRLESDSISELGLPAEHYRGAQTQRSFDMGRRPGEGCRREAAPRRQDAGPVTPPASRNAHRRLPDDAGDMTLRCLIVDDSRRFLDAARRLLERQGITVVGEASTSAEALRLVVELQPDVTLLDIDLGSESGCELARRLNRETDTALSRMILISTHAEQDYADLIAASPAVGFLSKSTLSAGAIRDLLGSQRDRDPGD
jgi:CheY-like chemotaxis protein